MNQAYTVTLLSPTEWNEVLASNPRYVNAHDSLGFADVREKKVFVRHTQWDKLNEHLIKHELDHLIEEHATHEDEHGIRHKKFFKQILAPIGGAILGSFLLPGLGTALGGSVGGALSGGLGSALGAGLGGFGGAKLGGASTGSAALQGGIAGLGSGANSLLGNPLGKVAGGIGKSLGFGATPTGAGAVSSSPGVSSLIPGATKKLAFNQLGNVGAQSSAVSPSMFTSGAAGQAVLPQTATQSILKNTVASPLGGFQGISSGISRAGLPGIAGQQAASGLGGLGQFGPGLAATGLGLGLAGAGQFLGPKTPEVPDFSTLPNVLSLQSKIGKPLSEPGGLAYSRLNERLGSQYGLSPTEESGIKRAFDNRRKNLTSEFKLIRPGADLATDSAYRQAIFELDREESESMAGAQRASRQQQLGEIQAALGVDETQLNSLTQLAQLDVAQIMLQTGMDAQKASEFKQSFGALGGTIAGAGISSLLPK